MMANVEDEEEEEEEEEKDKREESEEEGNKEKEEGSAADGKVSKEAEAEAEAEGGEENEMKDEAVSENLNGNGGEAGADDLQQPPEMLRKEKSKRGLLDEPIVREGKRQRHAVQRLAALSAPPSKRQSLDAVGCGTSLGDIEYVNFGISKAQNETLKSLHRLCYGTLGTVTSRKRDLRKFNGYAFDDKSADFEKKRTMAMKLTNNELHAIARILGSERGHTKEEAVMNVLHFLQKPEDKGKKVPKAKKRRHSSKSSGKRAKRSKTEKKGKEGNADKKKKKSKEAAAEESDENDDAGQSGEESSGDENMEESKISTKGMLEKTKSPGKSDASSSKSNEAKIEPSWGDGGPSNEEVETAISEILRSVDLVNCTMKQMCERIAEQFPNLDMATYKAALKERVKAALEKMEDS